MAIGLTAASENYKGASDTQPLSARADQYGGLGEVAKHQEESRRLVALIIVGSMAFLVAAPFVFVDLSGAKLEDIIKLVQTLITPVIGVVGAVTGFYYGSIRISVCEALMVSPSLGRLGLSGCQPGMQADHCLPRMFLGSIAAPVPPSRPGFHWATARKRCQMRRAAAGPEPRAAPAWGEHGEDPPFDAAEHGARLRPREGLQSEPLRRALRPPG